MQLIVTINMKLNDKHASPGTNIQDLTHWIGKLVNSVLFTFLKTQRKYK